MSAVALLDNRRELCCEKRYGCGEHLQTLSMMFLASLVLFAPAGLVSAQITLDEIQVIGLEDADDTAQTGDVVESEHTGSRSRIPRTRIEQPGAQLGELLNSISGVQQRQSGGFGSPSSITVRGASAAQSAVFLDGILLNSSGDPVIDLSTLELLNLDAIDIYKGSSPLQLGHASMGGAVNLSTSSKKDTSPTVRLGIGSYSLLSLSAAHQIQAGKWNWVGSASHAQSANDFPFISDNRTPLNPNDDVKQTRKNNQVRRNSVLLKGGYQSSGQARTDALLQITERDIGVPTKINNETDDANYETLKSQLHLSQTIDQWHDWNTRHSLYWHQSDSLYDDVGNTSGYGKQLIDTDTTSLGVKTYWERFINAGTLGLSTEVRKESLQQNDDININNELQADRTLLFSTAHLAIINTDETLLITPAIRWQQSEMRSQSANADERNNLSKKKESELGLQLGANWQFISNWTLTANAGSYFRQPSFGEFFSSTGLYKGNRNLLPEEGINVDFSLSYKTENLVLEATLFKSWHDNLIVTTYNDEGEGRSVNTGKADITGIELAATWKPSDVWEITANTTLQNPRNRDKKAGYLNKILPGEAKQTAHTRIQFQPSRTAYWYEWKSTRNMFYDPFNGLEAADTSLHNLGIDYRRGAWRFSARIENVGNDVVQDFLTFPKPGRTFQLALTRTL